METSHQPDDIIAQRYRIVAPLGQGGMGTTYEAEDLTNYKRVAIKVVSLRNITEWKILNLFEREAQVLAKLNHPGIPKYLDYFQVDTANDRRFYLVQELVAGETLANLVKKGWHADENKVKQIAIEVLEILEYLHQLNPPVIHRDIKPQNIVCHPDGRVFLVDFGAVQDVYRNTISSDRTFVGTLNYMPLEQLRGQASCGSDLYSLGVTLLFLLTHRDPSELPQLGIKIDFRSEIQISNKFAAWLEKMLEPAVEDRFQSASEAVKALGSGVGLKHKKPVGSKVVLTRNDGHLVLNIPPLGSRWRKKHFNQILEPMVWSVYSLFVVTIFVNIIFSGQAALFALIIAVVLLSTIVLITLSKQMQIEINLNQPILKYKSKVRWFGLPFFCKIDIRQINTNDVVNSRKAEIYNAYLQQINNKDDDPVITRQTQVDLFKVDLRLGNTNAQTNKLMQEIIQGLTPFGLTVEEEDWICAELSDFLATSEW